MGCLYIKDKLLLGYVEVFFIRARLGYVWLFVYYVRYKLVVEICLLKMGLVLLGCLFIRNKLLRLYRGLFIRDRLGCLFIRNRLA